MVLIELVRVKGRLTVSLNTTETNSIFIWNTAYV